MVPRRLRLHGGLQAEISGVGKNDTAPASMDIGVAGVGRYDGYVTYRGVCKGAKSGGATPYIASNGGVAKNDCTTGVQGRATGCTSHDMMHVARHDAFEPANVALV